MDSARQVIGCHRETESVSVYEKAPSFYNGPRVMGFHLTQETRAYNAFDDVASTIHQSLPRAEQELIAEPRVVDVVTQCGDEDGENVHRLERRRRWSPLGARPPRIRHHRTIRPYQILLASSFNAS